MLQYHQTRVLRQVILPALLFAQCAANRPDATPQFSTATQIRLVETIDREYLFRSGFNLSPDGGEGGLSDFRPESIAVDRDGSIVVADQASGRLLRLPSSAGPTSAPLSISNARVDDPRSVRIDALGNAYLADASSGELGVFGLRLQRGASLVLPFEALGMVMGRITGIAVAPTGDLFVSDAANARVFHLDPAGRCTDVFAESIESPWARLIAPAGLACSPDGTEIYVCDPGAGRIVVFDPLGAPIRLIGEGDLKEPVNAAVSSERQIFVADRKDRSVFVFSSNGALIDRIKGAPPEVPEWSGPTDVAVRDSTLWVADPAAGRIVVLRLNSPSR